MSNNETPKTDPQEKQSPTPNPNPTPNPTPKSPWWKEFYRKHTASIWIYSALALYLLYQFGAGFFGPEFSSVTELKKQIAESKIESIHLEPKDEGLYLVKVTLKGEEEEKEEESYAVPNEEVSSLSELAEKHEVAVHTIPPGQLKDFGEWSPITLWLLILIPMLIALVVFKISKSVGVGGQISSITNRLGVKARRATTDKTFDDVAGAASAKLELGEVVDFLKNPKKYARLGARVPRGVLLKGPPGTGKTLLAKAVAGEADVPMYEISASEFVQMFVGVGAARVRELFELAEKNSPSIIYVDEIDAIGKKRNTSGVGGGHDEREQTLNQLLTEMDGFDSSGSVIVMASTNRSEILDPALLRPGRFDRHVDVLRPTESERLEILEVHVKDVKLGSDVDLTLIAEFTVNFTGADLENLVNEAALIATRRDARAIELHDFEDAFDRIVEGAPTAHRLIDEVLRDSTAAHEAGHAVVADVLRERGLKEVHSVSIKPDARSFGRMRSIPRMELAHVTYDSLIVEMAILVSGRIGEQVYGKDDAELPKAQISSGASNDLMVMTIIANHMVEEYGFGEKTGDRVLRISRSPSFYDDTADPFPVSAKVRADADEDIQKLLAEARKLAEETLREYKDYHRAVTEALMGSESIRGSDLKPLRDENPPVKLTSEEESPAVESVAAN